MYDEGHLSLIDIYNFYNNFVYLTDVCSNSCMSVSVKEMYIFEENKF